MILCFQNNDIMIWLHLIIEEGKRKDGRWWGSNSALKKNIICFQDNDIMI